VVLCPPFVVGDIPDFGHAFSNRTYIRACGRFWLSYFQRVRRAEGEIYKIDRIPVKPKSTDGDKLAIRRDQPRCRTSIWICLCGHIRKVGLVIIYIPSFIEIRSMALETRGVEICPLPLTWSLGRTTYLSADLGFTAILSSSSFLVTYPPSSLNGTQPKPATCSQVSTIWKCMSERRGIPSSTNRGPNKHLFSTTSQLNNGNFNGLYLRNET